MAQQLSDSSVRCEVRRADVQLEAIHGDTVLFTALVSHALARSAPPCTLVGPGMIDLATYPQVVAEQPRRSFGRDAMQVLAVLLAFSGALFLYDLLYDLLDGRLYDT